MYSVMCAIDHVTECQGAAPFPIELDRITPSDLTFLAVRHSLCSVATAVSVSRSLPLPANHRGQAVAYPDARVKSLS